MSKNLPKPLLVKEGSKEVERPFWKQHWAGLGSRRSNETCIAAVGAGDRAMNYAQTMATLKKLGTAQNVKVYRRHGVGENLFGVSFANLGKLSKSLKTNHDLAVELWASGNADARFLATMVADPAEMTGAIADRWVKDLDNYVITDYFSSFIARTTFAETQLAKWMKSKMEFVRQAGYSTFASCLKDEREISDAACLHVLEMIEREIHGSANRAKHAMSMAICAIGIFRPLLAEEAIASSKRIGKVDVDHGETSCKTPDAAGYIEKALKRARGKKATAKKKKK